MPRTLQQVEVALQCLDLAVKASREHHEFRSVVDGAELFYAFVTGEPVASARTRIEQALDAANVR